MCGIAGIASRTVSLDRAVVDSMCNSLDHRGPDFKRVVDLSSVVLGHTRLSIIDLSEKGSQPMASPCGNYHLTYNGEIYNFREIKQELLDKGYSFSSETDSEVVLTSFVEWGKECFKRFNGMFALAIYSKSDSKIFFARDRLGQKPLYYYLNDGYISFSSEIPSLLQDPSVSREKSIAGVSCFLALGYILAPLTQYEGIKKLEPATIMELDLNDFEIKKTRYWNYLDHFKKKDDSSFEIIKGKIFDKLSEAVRLRLIADVPVGAFLSGGIDSSSIVALIKENKVTDLHTFSAGFKYDSYNELSEAKEASTIFDTIHHECIVDIKNEKELFDYVNRYGELFADTSLVPMVEVSSLASKHVKVVLSGDGADELFAGYITYKANIYYKIAQLIPCFIRRLLIKILGWLPELSSKKIGTIFKLSQFLKGSLHSRERAHYSWRLIFDVEDRVRILGEENRDIIEKTDPFFTFKKYFEQASDLDFLDQCLYVDSMTWLPDDILQKLDIATMASSIEGRSPYLDVNFVEYVASIPSRYKLKGLKTKFILKDCLRRILPDSILFRKKSGFNAPVGKWMSKGEGSEFARFIELIYRKKEI